VKNLRNLQPVLMVENDQAPIICDTPSEITPEFSLAYNQSFGFFDDIPNRTWKRMQRRVKKRVNHKYPADPSKNANLSAAWYQQNFEPDFGCQNERRVGGMGK